MNAETTGLIAATSLASADIIQVIQGGQLKQAPLSLINPFSYSGWNITPDPAATAQSVILRAGDDSDGGTGGSISLRGGSSAFAGGTNVGGAAALIGGTATNGATNTGGAVNVNGGVGATADGAVNIGTINNGAITIGKSTNTVTVAAPATFTQSFLQTSSSNNFTVNRTIGGNNSFNPSGSMSQTTAGDMVDGFGAALSFKNTDNTATGVEVGRIGFVREGADDSGAFILSVPLVGTFTTRLKVTPAGLVGINTTAPDKQFEINSATGDCLRLTYNDNNGTAANFADITVTASGSLALSPSSGSVILTGASNGILTVTGSSVLSPTWTPTPVSSSVANGTAVTITGGGTTFSTGVGGDATFRAGTGSGTGTASLGGDVMLTSGGASGGTVSNTAGNINIIPGTASGTGTVLGTVNIGIGGTSGPIVIGRSSTACNVRIYGNRNVFTPSSSVVGEVVSSLVASGSAVAITSATTINVASISLTAGDWIVSGNINFIGTAVTLAANANGRAGINVTSATLPSDGTEVCTGGSYAAVSFNDGVTIPPKRINISATTTVYLSATRGTWTGTSLTGFGYLYARRVLSAS